MADGVLYASLDGEKILGLWILQVRVTLSHKPDEAALHQRVIENKGPLVGWEEERDHDEREDDSFPEGYKKETRRY